MTLKFGDIVRLNNESSPIIVTCVSIGGNDIEYRYCTDTSELNQKWRCADDFTLIYDETRVSKWDRNNLPKEVVGDTGHKFKVKG